MAAKSSMSMRNTVVLTTSASSSPAPASTAVRLRSARSVCGPMSPSTIEPVDGSSATCPEVHTILLPPWSRTTWAWLYGPIAPGAPATVKGLFIAPPTPCPPGLGGGAGSSLDRHALRQISRLVDVAAPQHRHVVREQLERDHRQQRLQHRHRPGNVQHVIRQLHHLVIAFGRDRNDASLARAHLLHVAHDLVVGAVAGADEHHRHVLVDERDRPVLHLRRRIALG